MAYKTISVAGQLLGPGKTLLIPKSDWTSADDQWVRRGVVTIMGEEGDSLYIRSVAVDRDTLAVSASPSPPKGDGERKPTRSRKKSKKSSEE